MPPTFGTIGELFGADLRRLIGGLKGDVMNNFVLLKAANIIFCGVREDVLER